MPVIATAISTGTGCAGTMLPGTATATPVPASCMNQHILIPRVPTEPTNGRQILTRTHAITIPGQQKATINWTMRDPQGTPVDLSACLCEPDGSLSASSSESAGDCVCTYRLAFRLAEYLGGVACEYPAVVTSAETGELQVEIPGDSPITPGIYFGEFAMLECQGESPDVVIFSNRIYVTVGQNLWQTRMCSPAGPPSLSEVRLHLRDTDPSESFLLDNLAFGDEEIAHAMTLPIQYWNEIPPPIGTHTTTTFPYRYHWLMATAGYLFLAAAEQQRRNNLQYASGGVQVNDQNREPNYEQAAMRRLDEYRDFVKRKKSEINMDLCWGGTGSAYGSNYSQYRSF